MPLSIEFCEQLPGKSDLELFKILAQPEDYQPEALTAVAEELRKRKVDPAKVAALEALARTHKQLAAAKASEPLPWPMRLLVLFAGPVISTFLAAFVGPVVSSLLLVFSGPMVGMLLGGYFERRGFKKKASDCWVITGILTVVFILFGVIMAVFFWR